MNQPYTAYGEHLVQITPVGSAGAAAGSVLTERKVFGFAYQVNIKYNSQPAGTLVAVSAPLKNGNTQVLASVTGNTETTVSLQLDTTTVDGTADGGKRWPLVLEQHITVAISNGDPVANGVEVSIQVI